MKSTYVINTQVLTEWEDYECVSLLFPTLSVFSNFSVVK